MPLKIRVTVRACVCAPKPFACKDEDTTERILMSRDPEHAKRTNWRKARTQMRNFARTQPQNQVLSAGFLSELPLDAQWYEPAGDHK